MVTKELIAFLFWAFPRLVVPITIGTGVGCSAHTAQALATYSTPYVFQTATATATATKRAGRYPRRPLTRSAVKTLIFPARNRLCEQPRSDGKCSFFAHEHPTNANEKH